MDLLTKPRTDSHSDSHIDSRVLPRAMDYVVYGVSSHERAIPFYRDTLHLTPYGQPAMRNHPRMPAAAGEGKCP